MQLPTYLPKRDHLRRADGDWPFLLYHLRKKPIEQFWFGNLLKIVFCLNSKNLKLVILNDKTTSQSKLDKFAKKGSERHLILLISKRKAICSARISMQQLTGEMWRCSVDVPA